MKTSNGQNAVNDVLLMVDTSLNDSREVDDFDKGIVGSEPVLMLSASVYDRLDTVNDGGEGVPRTNLAELFL